ncbi:alpha/beta fold hydrolase [Actinoplanes sp. NPDC026670]|uniref:alpha/beta fold hydrolase n=1 Tax=Actinoplanes sp. NPDC026670 TaxID=3154700 RepID=UPI0033EB23DC
MRHGIQVIRDGPSAAPPLLLIHGSGAGSATWGPVVPALAARRHVIRVDLPGCGRSPVAPSYDVPGQAARVAGVLDDLGLRSVTVAGHSSGGYVATSLAEQRPDLVGPMALISTGPDLSAFRPQPLILRVLLGPAFGPLLWRIRTDTLIRRAILATCAQPAPAHAVSTPAPARSITTADATPPASTPAVAPPAPARSISTADATPPVSTPAVAPPASAPASVSPASTADAAPPVVIPPIVIPPVVIPDDMVAELRGITYRTMSAVLRANTAYLAERGVPDRLAALGRTALVIFGAADPRWEPSSAHRYTTSRVELLPGVGHLPMIEDPASTAELLLGAD